MEDRLIVTASPHIRDASTTRGLMGNVVIALLPAVLAAGLIFGVQALVLVPKRPSSRRMHSSISMKLLEVNLIPFKLGISREPFSRNSFIGRFMPVTEGMW